MKKGTVYTNVYTVVIVLISILLIFLILHRKRRVCGTRDDFAFSLSGNYDLKAGNYDLATLNVSDEKPAKFNRGDYVQIERRRLPLNLRDR